MKINRNEKVFCDVISFGLAFIYFEKILHNRVFMLSEDRKRHLIFLLDDR